jgi:hypothetical protein
MSRDEIAALLPPLADGVRLYVRTHSSLPDGSMMIQLYNRTAPEGHRLGTVLAAGDEHVPEAVGLLESNCRPFGYFKCPGSSAAVG